MKSLQRLTAGGLALAVLTLAACGDDGTVPVDNPPEVGITAPLPGLAVQPGSDVGITWVSGDDGTTTADLSYTAEGVSETTIATGVTGSSYTWTTPAENLLGLKVKVTVTDDAGQTAESESGVFAVVAHSDRGYVTAQTCGACHEQKFEDVFASGHPYKLTKIENGQQPTLPFTEVPSPPAGFGWEDVSYLIGGYAYKARFMDQDGYIMTTGVLGIPVQYNLERPDIDTRLADAAWGNYEGDKPNPKPYNCGSCHTTGWLTSNENGGVHQDGLPGIMGTWEETGIRCEQCHGPGVDHVATMAVEQIQVNTQSGLCGSCHFRDVNHEILASGGFIKHHEQYDELVNGPKMEFGCVECHEPHIGVRHGHAEQGGIIATCESCHADKVASNAHVTAVDCEVCHMPRATKNARTVHNFEADIRTHIFAINTEPFPKDSMFYVNPNFGTTETRPWVTLDFACYSCHSDGNGNGGDASVRTLEQLSAKAKNIHQ